MALAAIGMLGVAFLARKLDATYDYGLFRCFFGFFVGVLAWRAWRAAPALRQWSSTRGTAIEAAMLLGVFTYIALWGGPPFGLAGPLIFAVFIWVWASERGLVSRFFSRPTLTYLGKISYSIYLVHYPIILILRVMMRVAARLLHFNYENYGIKDVDNQVYFIHYKSLWVSDLMSIPYLALVVAVAHLTFHYIEKPGRRMFAGKAPSESRAQVLASPLA